MCVHVTVEIRTNMLDTKATAIDWLEFSQDTTISFSSNAAATAMPLYLYSTHSIVFVSSSVQNHSFGKAKKGKKKNRNNEIDE